MTFSFFLIISCHRFLPRKLDVVSAVSECRIVQQKIGKTCIPTKPQRIIALDSSVIPDSLLALGIKPIGITFVNQIKQKMFHGLSTDDIAGIELIGTNEQPSLEKLLLLQPDLILATERSERMYGQLSGIAPTVIIEVDELQYSIKDNFRSIAQILDRKEQAEKFLYQYQQRAKVVRKFVEDRLGEMEISMIVYNGGNFYKPASSATTLQVLNDIGIKINSLLLRENLWSSVSAEVLSEYDADILFILNADDKSSADFFQNPLIASLRATKNNRTYVVDSAVWHPYGPLGMSRLVNYLYEYLTKML